MALFLIATAISTHWLSVWTFGNQETQDELQGKWTLVAREVGGEIGRLDFKDRPEAYLKFDGDQLTWHLHGEAVKPGRFKLNSWARPRQIDIPVEGKVVKGLYILGRQESLRVCIPLIMGPFPEQRILDRIPRPPDFDTSDMETIVLHFKRVKPEADGKKP